MQWLSSLAKDLREGVVDFASQIQEEELTRKTHEYVHKTRDYVDQNVDVSSLTTNFSATLNEATKAVAGTVEKTIAHADGAAAKFIDTAAANFIPKAPHAAQAASADIRGDLAEARLREREQALATNPAALLEPVDNAVTFREWCASFELLRHTAEIDAWLREREQLRQTHASLVPARLSYREFWQRYYYELGRLQQQEQRRVSLLRGGLSSSAAKMSDWGDDSWDDVPQVTEHRRPPAARDAPKLAQPSPPVSSEAPAAAKRPAAVRRPAPVRSKPKPVPPAAALQRAPAPGAGASGVEPGSAAAAATEASVSLEQQPVALAKMPSPQVAAVEASIPPKEVKNEAESMSAAAAAHANACAVGEYENPAAEEASSPRANAMNDPVTAAEASSGPEAAEPVGESLEANRALDVVSEPSASSEDRCTAKDSADTENFSLVDSPHSEVDTQSDCSHTSAPASNDVEQSAPVRVEPPLDEEGDEDWGDWE